MAKERSEQRQEREREVDVTNHPPSQRPHRALHIYRSARANFKSKDQELLSLSANIEDNRHLTGSTAQPHRPAHFKHSRAVVLCFGRHSHHRMTEGHNQG